MKNLIETYQCPGCVAGPNPNSCESFLQGPHGCTGHRAGTFMFPAGQILLGLPRGFNRVGSTENPIYLHINDAELDTFEWKSKFTVPTWKHLDEHGNTLMRVYLPRLNTGATHVYKGNTAFYLVNCLEIRAEDIEEMD